jgi:excisionase family DNA binding protein
MQITSKNSVSLLKEHEVAKTLAISVDTVRRWRLKGKGPTFIRVGNSVRYLERDLLAWLASRPTGGERVTEVHHG